MKWTAGTLAAILVALTAVPALGGDPTLAPNQDTTLYEVQPVFGNGGGPTSNGAGDHFFTGITALGNVRRGLLAFDIAGAIPAGSVIASVTLTLQMSRTISGASEVQVYRASSDWGEGDSDATGEEGAGAPAEPGDATWTHTFYPNAFWTAPGGDFSSAVSATQTVGGPGPYTWGSTPEMVADVQSWLDNPSSNFGWLIMGDEGTTPSAKRFNTRENTSDIPQLAITYQAPVPTSPVWAFSLLVLTLIVLAVMGIRRVTWEATS